MHTRHIDYFQFQYFLSSSYSTQCVELWHHHMKSALIADNCTSVLQPPTSLCPCAMADIKKKKRKSQTEIFHTCAQTTHIVQLLPYLEVKVRSLMQLLTPSFVSIGSGVLLPGVVVIPTFPTLRSMAYTTGLGYHPTSDNS